MKTPAPFLNIGILTGAIPVYDAETGEVGKRPQMQKERASLTCFFEA
jgi:hypothetical protein